MFASADTIILKNGKKIENVRIWEENGLVKCYRFGVIVGYLKKNVKRIEEIEIEEEFHEYISKPEELKSDNKEQTDFQKNVFKQFQVIKVYDGDSLKLSDNNIELIVRLIGIDAPETAHKRKGKPEQPYGEEAKKYLEKLILNKMVSIKGYGTDIYSRQLAEIFSENKNIGIELLKAGFAETYKGNSPKNFDPTLFRKAEKKAKKFRKGIWALGSKYVSPGKWRKKYKQ